MAGAPVIVVVECSEDLRAFIVYALEHDGYRVYASPDADEAFAALPSTRPVLVITDLLPPGATSGLDFITRIRRELPPPPPAILACSGFPGLEAEARRRGADLFLRKPFDLDSLRAAVSSLLARRPMAAGAVERAARESLRLRQGASAAAHVALARLAPRMEEMVSRAEWTVRWIAAYFGFGRAFCAVERDGALAVLASSDVDWLPPDADAAARLPLSRDVVETSSTVVLPDTEAFGGAAGDSRVRFFAGVPIAVGSVAIGALCVVDTERRTMDGEDLALLEAAGRRASAVLGGDGEASAPLWAGPALASREMLLLATELELRRTRRSGEWLHLLSFASARPAAASSWAAALDTVVTPRRRLVAALGEDRFALMLVRAAGDLGRLTAAVRQLRDRAAITGGGLVSMEGADLVGVSERELVALAGGMLDRQLRLGRSEIEHVVIRREPWPAAADQPAAR